MDVPHPLRASVRRIEHDRIRVVLRPVHAPLPLAVVAGFAMTAAGLISVLVPLGLALASVIPFVLCALLTAPLAFGLGTVHGARALQLDLSEHHLRVRVQDVLREREFVVPLADLRAVSFAGDFLELTTFDQVIRVAFPSRAAATRAAVEDLLASVADRARALHGDWRDIPGALQRTWTGIAART
ncbi:MAG: hypothetical protein ABMB14_07170 [Myxococcota bacterium]